LKEEIVMAQHNPQSIPYLVTVLVAIAVCFMIALSILHGGGGDSHKATDHGSAHKSEVSESSHGHTNDKPADTKMGHDASPADTTPDGAALDGEGHSP
jgi:hypothetical protein